jgi:hypothetical protein
MTIEASDPSSATGDDAALLSEIAPAMRKKLELDGVQRGIMTANTLIALAVVVGQARWHAGFAYQSELSFGALGIAVAALCTLPFFLKKRSVSAELRYRRQHGKWRWER